jgi:hypothetical protein
MAECRRKGNRYLKEMQGSAVYAAGSSSLSPSVGRDILFRAPHKHQPAVKIFL